jgi:hypothetical protein
MMCPFMFEQPPPTSLTTLTRASVRIIKWVLIVCIPCCTFPFARSMFAHFIVNLCIASNVDEVWVMVGFILGACVNILGLLVTSRCFNNKPMANAWPSLWENEGVAIVCLWYVNIPSLPSSFSDIFLIGPNGLIHGDGRGFAYLSVCTSYRRVPYLVLVFCFEKIYYTVAWWYLRYLRNCEARGSSHVSCFLRIFPLLE